MRRMDMSRLLLFRIYERLSSFVYTNVSPPTSRPKIPYRSPQSNYVYTDSPKCLHSKNHLWLYRPVSGSAFLSVFEPPHSECSYPTNMDPKSLDLVSLSVSTVPALVSDQTDLNRSLNLAIGGRAGTGGTAGVSASEPRAKEAVVFRFDGTDVAVDDRVFPVLELHRESEFSCRGF
jgi:hypothetical protein